MESGGIIGTLDKTIEGGSSNLGFVVLRGASEPEANEEPDNLASETEAAASESEIEDAALTGSVLSGGSLWIIIGVALVAVIAVIALVLAKKKQGK